MICAGAIGDRSVQLTGLQDGQNLGLTGFGASGHLVLKMVGYLYPKTGVAVFARGLRAIWAGESTEKPPEKLDCIIDTTPAWGPVLEALKNLEPGGRLVINAIAKECADKHALLGLDYSRDLWREKEIKSVANITRRNVSEFLACPRVANQTGGTRISVGRDQPGLNRTQNEKDSRGESSAAGLSRSQKITPR